MGYLKEFVILNYKVLLGVLLGCILGYIHWFYFGCYWGTYPFSSECWVNCSIGGIFGGFIMSIFND